jgi:hypothetical protein
MTELGPGRQEEDQHNPIQFFYVEHLGEENSARLLEQLQDYDVVALEFVNPSEHKKIFQGTINQVTHSIDPHQVDTILGGDAGRALSKDPFANALIKGLAGTNKEVILIDAAQEDLPELLDIEASEKALNQAILHESTDIAMTHLKEFISAYGAMNIKREHLVAEQIRHFATKLESSKKIAVVQGAAHTHTYLELKRSGVAAEREFLTDHPSGSSYRGQQQVFPLSVTLVRKLAMLPNEPVPEDSWRQCLVAEYAQFTTWDEAPEASKSYIESVDKALQKIEGEELQTLLTSIDNVRETVRPDQTGQIVEYRKAIRGLLDKTLITPFDEAA